MIVLLGFDAASADPKGRQWRVDMGQDGDEYVIEAPDADTAKRAAMRYTPQDSLAKWLVAVACISVHPYIPYTVGTA